MFDDELANNGTGNPNVLWTVFPAGNNVAAIPIKAIVHTCLFRILAK